MLEMKMATLNTVILLRHDEGSLLLHEGVELLVDYMPQCTKI